MQVIKRYRSEPFIFFRNLCSLSISSFCNLCSLPKSARNAAILLRVKCPNLFTKTNPASAIVVMRPLFSGSKKQYIPIENTAINNDQSTACIRKILIFICSSFIQLSIQSDENISTTSHDPMVLLVVRHLMKY